MDDISDVPGKIEPLLYLDGVQVSFDGFKALNNLSLVVEPGEMRAVIGPNGRGLDAAAARPMLTSAFCRTVTDRVQGRGLAERIAELMDAAMPVSDV